MVDILLATLAACVRIFNEAAIYIIFGFVIAGMIRVYIRPESVAHYFHDGRLKSVLYASLLGVPIPLCSCGVVPAVAGIKKQGANNGACLAFLIATPESGIDSIALTYSLLDPVLTIIRPVTAFVTAFAAGLVENFTGANYLDNKATAPDKTCLVDGCCDGVDCPPEDHANHHTFLEKFRAGMRYAFGELLGDLAVWFMLGIVIAGLITALVPETWISNVVGSGIRAYVSMFLLSLPMYVCATMSTPVAAALILKGLSPGAALVLLIAGPATNMASLTMVGRILGRRTMTIYLGAIVICAILAAYCTDFIYASFHLPAPGTQLAGQEEWMPQWLEIGASALLAALILRVYWRKAKAIIGLVSSTGSECSAGGSQNEKCSCGTATLGGS
jgi:uncharacterized protein